MKIKITENKSLKILPIELKYNQLARILPPHNLHGEIVIRTYNNRLVSLTDTKHDWPDIEEITKELDMRLEILPKGTQIIIEQDDDTSLPKN